MRDERRVVVIGTGALGLGFLGPELSPEAQVWFLDVEAKLDLLRRLERERSYALNLAGVGVRSVRVENVRGATRTGDEAHAEIIAGAELCFTAVGAKNLPHVAPVLARAAAMRSPTSPLTVLCAENGLDVAKGLAEQVGKDANILAADTVMGRMCRWEGKPSDNHFPLFGPAGAAVVAEEFYGIPYRRSGLRPPKRGLRPAKAGEMPALPFGALRPRSGDEFDLDEHIKLFAHNCLHGLFAYAAARRGCTHLHQVAGDARVLDRAERMLYAELMPALEKQDAGVFDRAEYMNYSVHLVRRILSESFADTVERGVRGAAEKLVPAERWVSAVRFVRAAGIAPVTYLETIADVIAVSGILRGRKLRAVLSERCGFTPEEIEEIHPLIESAIGRGGVDGKRIP